MFVVTSHDNHPDCQGSIHEVFGPFLNSIKAMEGAKQKAEDLVNSSPDDYGEVTFQYDRITIELTEYDRGSGEYEDGPYFHFFQVNELCG